MDIMQAFECRPTSALTKIITGGEFWCI